MDLLRLYPRTLLWVGLVACLEVGLWLASRVP